jgi:hypothetical protein
MHRPVFFLHEIMRKSTEKSGEQLTERRLDLKQPKYYKYQGKPAKRRHQRH